MSFTIENSTWNDETQKFDSSKEVRGVGTTLHTRRGVVQVMSDIWDETTFVTYWDEEAQKVREATWVENVTVDATDEVLQKVRDYVYKTKLERNLEAARDQAAKVCLGSIVEVTSGRKGKGTRGKVVVEIMRPYSMGWKSVMARKVAVATSDVMVKVAASNGKVYENYRDVVWAWVRNVTLAETPEIDMENVKETAEAETCREMLRYVPAA